MHLLDGKKGILSPKKGLVFELRPQLAAFYRGPTPMDPQTGSRGRQCHAGTPDRDRIQHRDRVLSDR